MEEIIKLIESTEIYKNSISHNLKKEYQDYHYDIDLKIITELHNKAKALQLQQIGVIKSVCEHEYYDSDQDFIANQCVKCGHIK